MKQAELEAWLDKAREIIAATIRSERFAHEVLADALEAAYSAGRDAGREEAAQIAESRKHSVNDLPDDIADAIRTLSKAQADKADAST